MSQTTAVSLRCPNCGWSIVTRISKPDNRWACCNRQCQHKWVEKSVPPALFVSGLVEIYEPTSPQRKADLWGGPSQGKP